MVCSEFPLTKCAQRVTHTPHQYYHVWTFELNNMPGNESNSIGSVGNNQYQWYHATRYEGLLGILREGIMLPSCLETLYYPKDLKNGAENIPWKPQGFFATGLMFGGHQETDQQNHMKKLIQRYLSGKCQHGIVVTGVVWGTRKKIDSGGIWAKQKAVRSHLITHNPKEKRWCLHSATSPIHALHLIYQHTQPPDNYSNTLDEEDPPPELEVKGISLKPRVRTIQEDK